MNRIMSLNNLTFCLVLGFVLMSLSSCFMTVNETKSCPYKEAKSACAGGCEKACAKVKEMEADKAAMCGKKACGCDKAGAKCNCADKKSCGCGDKGASCDKKM